MGCLIANGILRLGEASSHSAAHPAHNSGVHLFEVERLGLIVLNPRIGSLNPQVANTPEKSFSIPLNYHKIEAFLAPKQGLLALVAAAAVIAGVADFPIRQPS